jgi:hypothetical protein
LEWGWRKNQPLPKIKEYRQMNRTKVASELLKIAKGLTALTNMQPDKATRQLSKLYYDILEIKDNDAPSGSSYQAILLKRFKKIADMIEDLAFDAETQLEDYLSRQDDDED